MSAAMAPDLSEKQQFLDVFAREHATTLKVMRAFPASEASFTPHPRSYTAKRLMWTFVIEQGALLAALNGTWSMPPKFPPDPATLDEVFVAYQHSVAEVKTQMAAATSATLNNKVPFPSGPGQMGEIRIMDLAWLFLMDSIHHRGQLSVYVRLAGGKVPSIYGPSADEPFI